MIAPRIIFVSCEENALGVHAIHFDNFIVAGLELPFELSNPTAGVLLVEAVEVDVGVAVAPTGPNKAVAGFQDTEVVINIDPRVGSRFGKHLARSSHLGLDEI